LALPAEPDLSRVRSVLQPNWSVLDLGCGVGRIANPLAAEGHAVVAVDDSAEMLAHIAGPERVLHDIWTLDLGRRFDAVLALSHLLNSRSVERRRALLRICRTHLRAGGRLIVQRYAPGWTPVQETRTVGEIEVHLHHITPLDDGFAAQVTYRIGPRAWTQTFDAAVVDDTELNALSDAAALTVVDVLDDTGAWVVLT
jgi:SAM-dependent methyltransferase